MGGVAFPIERGTPGRCTGAPHVSHLSVTCLKVREPTEEVQGGKNMLDEETPHSPYKKSKSLISEGPEL
jgi:hypothetical protein